MQPSRSSAVGRVKSLQDGLGKNRVWLACWTKNTQKAFLLDRSSDRYLRHSLVTASETETFACLCGCDHPALFAPNIHCMNATVGTKTFEGRTIGAAEESAPIARWPMAIDRVSQHWLIAPDYRLRPRPLTRRLCRHVDRANQAEPTHRYKHTRLC